MARIQVQVEKDPQVKSNNKVEEALRRWRADIALLENEIEEFILPEKLLSALSNCYGVVDVNHISASTLNGYLPSFVQ